MRLSKTWTVSLQYSINGHKYTQHAPGPRRLYSVGDHISMTLMKVVEKLTTIKSLVPEGRHLRVRILCLPLTSCTISGRVLSLSKSLFSWSVSYGTIRTHEVFKCCFTTVSLLLMDFSADSSAASYHLTETALLQMAFVTKPHGIHCSTKMPQQPLMLLAISPFL